MLARLFLLASILLLTLAAGRFLYHYAAVTDPIVRRALF